MMGLGLAQQLLKLGHTVAIIDADPLACRFAREKIGVMAFEGSAVSIERFFWKQELNKQTQSLQHSAMMH